ncbi:MAG: molybdopterin cofactor-binding domain-containing protein, partial [Betaproteobacteria bacterium]
MTKSTTVESTRNMGASIPRIEARAKVTGTARYPSDEPLANAVHASVLTSAIARGSIVRIASDAAKAMPGVIEILTYANANEVGGSKFFADGGTASTSIVPLADRRIWHDGQIVAMIIAETAEAARESAYLLSVEYAAETPATGFEAQGATTEDLSDVSKRHEDPAIGDAAAAFAGAEVLIDNSYSTPTQHHNPMELFTTSCYWSGEELTIHEPSQFVYGLKNGVAEQLKMDPRNVRVISRYIGGAFGSKGSVTPRTALVALASRRVGRPVKLVLTRAQGFTVATYRAETRHRV